MKKQNDHSTLSQALIAIINTVIIYTLFYYLFQLGIWIKASNEPLRHDIGRGISWQIYLYLFAFILLLGNLAFQLLTKRRLADRLIVNSSVLIIMYLLFLRDIQSLPYAIGLPHAIITCLLLGLPILSSKFFSKTVLNKLLAGMQER